MELNEKVEISISGKIKGMGLYSDNKVWYDLDFGDGYFARVPQSAFVKGECCGASKINQD